MLCAPISLWPLRLRGRLCRRTVTIQLQGAGAKYYIGRLKRARRVIVIIFWYIAGITFSKNNQKPNQLNCVIVAMKDLSLRPKDVIIR